MEIEPMLSSLEVAEMVEKQHKDLMRDIRRYMNQFNESNIAPVEFFRKTTYKDSKGEERTSYLVTKKGCEFIAHKLTGVKGTKFTATYINRFHEMEKDLMNPQPAEIPVGEVASYLKAMDRVAVRQNTAPYKIAQAFKMVSEQFGIQLPVDFVKVPEYEQMSLEFSKGGGAA